MNKHSGSLISWKKNKHKVHVPFYCHKDLATITIHALFLIFALINAILFYGYVVNHLNSENVSAIILND